jgi:hypothetical protein
MSALLTLCVALLPLASPGHGTQHWEPCTGKAGTRGHGVGWLAWSWRSVEWEVPLPEAETGRWMSQDTGTLGSRSRWED